MRVINSINPLTLITFLASVIFFYFSAPPLFADPDGPWHIANGDQIRLTGEIPKTNMWSFAEPNHVMHNFAWLWDLGISHLHNLFGAEGLFIFSICAMALTAAMLCQTLLKTTKLTDDAVLMATAVSVFTLNGITFGIRSAIFTYLMVLLFQYILHKSRGSQTFQSLLVLPIAMALWANIHGGFIFAYTILLAYWIEAWSSKNWHWLKNITLIGILCAAASLLTPMGINIYFAIFDSITPHSVKFVSEWLPFSFKQYVGFDLLFIVLIFAVSFKGGKAPLADKLLTTLWIIASINSVRNLPILALVSARLIAINLEHVLPHKRSYNFKSPNANLIIIAAIFVVLPLLSALPARELLIQKPRVVMEERIPLEEMKYIRDNHPNVRFLNEYTLGGYIIYYNRDVQPVFIDGRGGMAYSDEMLGDYYQAIYDHEHDEVAKKYGANGMFISKSHVLLDLINKDVWEMVYEGPVAYVFLRKNL